MGMDVLVEDQVTHNFTYEATLHRLNRCPRISSSTLHLILWPVLLIPMLTAADVQLRVAGVTALMAAWWATEAIPLPATALLPMVLFPLLVIREAKLVAPNYTKNTSMLFLGGFIVAAAIEKTGLHRRIALQVLLMAGTSPNRILFGFMMVCWMLSMWMSNTATCVMMTPIIETIIQSVENAQEGELPNTRPRGMSQSAPETPMSPEHNPIIDQNPSIEMPEFSPRSPKRLAPSEDPDLPIHDESVEQQGVMLRDSNSDTHKFGRQLCLGVAYACSVGGFATLTGTGPNIVLSGQWSLLFPKADDISFAVWMLYGLPVSFSILMLTFLVVRTHGRWRGVKLGRALEIPSISDDEVRDLLRQLGPVKWNERVVLISFGILVAMWMLREPQVFDGWGAIYPKGMVSDTTAVMLIVVLLFMMPAERPDFSNTDMTPKILNWGDMTKLPWGIVILLGGGFALADAFKASGLSDTLGEHLDVLQPLPLPLLVLCLCAAITMGTELTSNVSTCTIMLPVLAALAQSLRINPMLLMIPGTVSTSLAFMLPVATPPNAIVFATGRLRVRHMAAAGFLLNLAGVLVISFSMLTYGVLVFGIDLSSFPCWAEEESSEAYKQC